MSDINTDDLFRVFGKEIEIKKQDDNQNFTFVALKQEKKEGFQATIDKGYVSLTAPIFKIRLKNLGDVEIKKGDNIVSIDGKALLPKLIIKDTEENKLFGFLILICETEQTQGYKRHKYKS